VLDEFETGARFLKINVLLESAMAEIPKAFRPTTLAIALPLTELAIRERDIDHTASTKFE
jgi:hypothetical protein